MITIGITTAEESSLMLTPEDEEEEDLEEMLELSSQSMVKREIFKLQVFLKNASFLAQTIL